MVKVVEPCCWMIVMEPLGLTIMDSEKPVDGGWMMMGAGSDGRYIGGPLFWEGADERPGTNWDGGGV